MCFLLVRHQRSLVPLLRREMTGRKLRLGVTWRDGRRDGWVRGGGGVARMLLPQSQKALVHREGSPAPADRPAGKAGTTDLPALQKSPECPSGSHQIDLLDQVRNPPAAPELKNSVLTCFSGGDLVTHGEGVGVCSDSSHPPVQYWHTRRGRSPAQIDRIPARQDRSTRQPTICTQSVGRNGQGGRMQRMRVLDWIRRSRTRFPLCLQGNIFVQNAYPPWRLGRNDAVVTARRFPRCSETDVVVRLAPPSRFYRVYHLEFGISFVCL